MSKNPSTLRSFMSVYMCVVIGLAAARFGAVHERILYQTLLLLLGPSTIAMWQLAGRRLGWRFFGLAFVGLWLLANAAFRPTTEAYGFELAVIAWSGLVVGLWLAGESRHARFLVLSLVALGALEAGYGLMQAIGGVDRIWSYERDLGTMATGTLINRNHFAGLLNMAIGLSIGVLYAGFARQGGRSRSEVYAWVWLMILACAVLGLAMALSLSRAGIVITIGMMVFVFLLLIWRQREGGRGLPALVVGVLLVVMVGLIFGYGAETLVERFDEIAADDRFSIYRNTLRLIADHPLLGVGPGMYGWRFRSYQTSAVNEVHTHAHNDYLQAAAEWGIPVAILVWGLVGWRFWRAVRLFLATRHPLRAGLALGCAAAILSILAHSLVDFNLHIPSNLLVFTSIVGVAWGVDSVSTKEWLGQRRRGTQ